MLRVQAMWLLSVSDIELISKNEIHRREIDGGFFMVANGTWKWYNQINFGRKIEYYFLVSEDVLNERKINATAI